MSNSSEPSASSFLGSPGTELRVCPSIRHSYFRNKQQYLQTLNNPFSWNSVRPSCPWIPPCLATFQLSVVNNTNMAAVRTCMVEATLATFIADRQLFWRSGKCQYGDSAIYFDVWCLGDNCSLTFVIFMATGYKIIYNSEATKISPTNSTDDGAPHFLPSAYRCIPSSPLCAVPSNTVRLSLANVITQLSQHSCKQND